MADEKTSKPADASTPDDQSPASSDAPATKPAAQKTAKPAAEGDAKPAAKPKKEKPPALEDKPFPEFMTQHFVPGLKDAMAKVGVNDLELVFEKRPYPLQGVITEECWQVVGHWDGGQRQFVIGFSKDDISAPKFFCFADKGATPSTLESFMIDERKVTLDLMVLYTLQRLNGQKWLVRN
jgi:hypothetical protein